MASSYAIHWTSSDGPITGPLGRNLTDERRRNHSLQNLDKKTHKQQVAIDKGVVASCKLQSHKTKTCRAPQGGLLESSSQLLSSVGPVRKYGRRRTPSSVCTSPSYQPDTITATRPRHEKGHVLTPELLEGKAQRRKHPSFQHALVVVP